MNDLHEVGGIPVILEELHDAGLLHGDALTVTGNTIAEEPRAIDPPAIADLEADFLYTVAEPKNEQGAIRILTGNLAPDGAVIKITGEDHLRHEGPVRIFEEETDAMKYVQEGKVESGDVIGIRNEGPQGGPGCARCWRHLRRRRPGPRRRRRPVYRRPILRRDAGFSIGHVAPKPSLAGPSPRSKTAT